MGRLGRRILANKLYLGSQVRTFNPAAEFWQISARATYRNIQLCCLVLANHRARTRGYWFWLRVPSINLVAILLIECVESGNEYCCSFGLATFYPICKSLWRTNTDNTQLLKPGCRTFLRFFPSLTHLPALNSSSPPVRCLVSYQPIDQSFSPSSWSQFAPYSDHRVCICQVIVPSPRSSCLYLGRHRYFSEPDREGIESGLEIAHYERVVRSSLRSHRTETLVLSQSDRWRTSSLARRSSTEFSNKELQELLRPRRAERMAFYKRRRPMWPGRTGQMGTRQNRQKSSILDKNWPDQGGKMTLSKKSIEENWTEDLEQPLVSCRPSSPRNSIKWSASPCLAILIHLQMVSHWLETPVNINSKSLITSDAIRCVVKPTILSPKVGKITTSCVADYLSPYSRNCTCGRLLEPAIRGADQATNCPLLANINIAA